MKFHRFWTDNNWSSFFNGLITQSYHVYRISNSDAIARNESKNVYTTLHHTMWCVFQLPKKKLHQPHTVTQNMVGKIVLNQKQNFMNYIHLVWFGRNKFSVWFLIWICSSSDHHCHRHHRHHGTLCGIHTFIWRFKASRQRDFSKRWWQRTTTPDDIDQ